MPRTNGTLPLSDRCPGCKDQAIVQGRSIFETIEGPIWIALGWDPDGDYDTVPRGTLIDFCPFCGIRLPSSESPNVDPK